MKLENTIRHYAWGSTTALARLQGRPPVGEPEAELWIGGHPQAPSTVTVAGARVRLDRLLAERPAETLGPVAQRFGAVLPFLLKVLAVAEPLSIQAHPTLAQAAAGFAREEAAGLPINAAQRSYRDRNHKPEVVVALEPYWLLCGFRPYAVIARHLAAIGVPALQSAVDALRATPGAAALCSLMGAALHLDASQRGDLVARAAAFAASQPQGSGGSTELDCGAVGSPARATNPGAAGHGVARDGTAAPATLPGATDPGPAADPLARAATAAPTSGSVSDAAGLAAVARWVRRLAARYPNDVGVLSPYLLNLVHLAPGDGVYTGAGTLHAMLRGTAVELQASSDNVLRGGLTPKHIDLPELLRVATFAPQEAPVMRPPPAANGERRYPTPAAEFALSSVALDALPRGTAFAAVTTGPEVLLLLHGAGVLADPAGREIHCLPGEAVFVPAAVGSYRARGTALMFRARVPNPALSPRFLG